MRHCSVLVGKTNTSAGWSWGSMHLCWALWVYLQNCPRASIQACIEGLKEAPHALSGVGFLSILQCAR